MNKNPKNIIAPLFFLLILITGIGIYKDYGFSYDEQVSRGNGIMSALYVNAKLHHVFLSKENVENRLKAFKQENAGDSTIVAKKDSVNEYALLTYEDRDYGSFFEMVLVGFETVLKLHDTRAIYHMRHLVTFLQFWLALIFFYLACTKIFGDWKYGLFGALFLLLSPRIFGQSFYNSKDLVQLDYMVIAFYTLCLFLEKRTIKYAIIHGLACAIATDIRIIGMLSFFITGLAIIIEWFVERKKHEGFYESIKPFLGITIIFIMAFVVFTFLFWPFLWSDPIGNFKYTIANMKQFRWTGPVYYMGHKYSIPAWDFPWHFLLGWIAISTPILYLLLAVMGLGVFIRRLLSPYFSGNLTHRFEIYGTLFFIIPMAAFIVLKPVVYTDWRHFYFVYPFLLIIALVGLNALSELLNKTFPNITYSKYLITGLVVINSTFVAWGMAENHPYESVYFNQFVNRDKPGQFELDYWGLSYIGGYKYVLQNDTQPEIKMSVESYAGTQSVKILPTEWHKRIKLVTAAQAQYLLTANNSSPFIKAQHFTLVYTIKSYGMPILYIYKVS